MYVRPITTFTALSALLIAFAGLYLYLDTTEDGARPLLPLRHKELTPFDAHEVTFNKKTEYAHATGTYPQFPAASNEFNTAIQSYVEHAISEHAENSEENWKARYETADTEEQKTLHQVPTEDEIFTLQSEWHAETANSNLVSVLVSISGFSGGAHGYEYQSTFTYDYSKKKSLTLDDIFAKYPHYLEHISKATYENIIIQLRKNAGDLELDESWAKEGTAPKKENFTLFTVNERNRTITFYFSQYQVAAYVFGTQEVTLPLPRDSETPSWLR